MFEKEKKIRFIEKNLFKKIYTKQLQYQLGNSFPISG